MKKFKVTVTRRDEYEIEIDENIYEDPDWKKEFEESFWNMEGPETIARDLAGMQSRFGKRMDFIEGYGYIKRDGELPFSSRDYDKEGKLLPENKRRQPTEGLNIMIIDEDDDIEYDIEEMED